MKTTLFALVLMCDTAILDDYEVDRMEIPDTPGASARIEWLRGDERASFQDQELNFEPGQEEFEIVDEDGTTYVIQFFAAAPRLTVATMEGLEASLAESQEPDPRDKLAADFKVAHELIEARFAELNDALRRGDLSEATFPRTGTEAQIELYTRQADLLWVLEMLPKPIGA